jgi:hypothetical protein
MLIPINAAVLNLPKGVLAKQQHFENFIKLLPEVGASFTKLTCVSDVTFGNFLL